MADPVAAHLGRNIRQLREARGLTQQQMAKLAELPRATWANLESGEANPTLAVLHRVATAFQVTLEELVATPRSGVAFYPRGTLPEKARGAAKLQKLLPDAIPGMEMDRMELPPRTHDHGRPAHAGHPRVPDLREGADRPRRGGRALGARARRRGRLPRRSEALVHEPGDDSRGRILGGHPGARVMTQSRSREERDREGRRRGGFIPLLSSSPPCDSRRRPARRSRGVPKSLARRRSSRPIPARS